MAEPIDVEFEQLSFDVDIVKEPKHFVDTGSEMPIKKKKTTRKKKKIEKKMVESAAKTKTPTSEVKEIIKEVADEGLKTPEKTKTEPEAHIKTKMERLGVNFQSTIVTNNSFLKAINETNRLKQEQEKKEISQIPVAYPYVKSDILTDAEKRLYFIMKNNLLLKEKVTIFSKVRLADIINVDDRVVEYKQFFYKIASKHIDFLIVDSETLDIICAVELDDYTHDRPETIERDKFVYFALQAAGIQLIRIKLPIDKVTKSDLGLIEDHIAEHFRPRCYMCGSDTRVKVINKKGMRHRFYSCTHFPVCRWSLDFDS